MKEYRFPPIDLLMNSQQGNQYKQQSFVDSLAGKLDDMFASFKMDARVVDRFFNDFAILLKVKLGQGVSPGTIRRLRADIELRMSNPVDFRDEPGGRNMIIAVKNYQRPVVALRDIIWSSEFREAESKLTVAAGIDLFGGKLVLDLASLPNLLVAGVTGSGKSVFLHDIILSIAYKAHPDEVKLILLDMKGIEFPLLNGIPHMLQDAVTDTKTGLEVLEWLQNERDQRLVRMKRLNVENIEDYNRVAEDRMPRIVVIIDEFMEFVFDWKQKSDLYYPFNAILTELVKSSRETGIHLVLATQRPDTENVITPEISALLPSRASFCVVDSRESKIVINRTGAERLLGEGDLIFTRNEADEGIHAQAAFVTDKEINQVVEFLRHDSGWKNAEPDK